MGAPLSFPRRQLSVAQYHKMIDAGVFHEDERIELIEGEMIEMPPIGPPHLAKVNRFARLFVHSVQDSAIVSVQNPIALPPNNEPQPDIVLLRPRADDYETKLPSVEDILLIVEIADSSLNYDRDAKIPLYARHGIVEVWLADLQANVFSVFLDPSANGYQRVLTPGRDETIAPLMLPTVRIRLAEFWK